MKITKDRGTDSKQFKALLASEQDSAALYRGLAASAQGERKMVFLELAAVEDRHAAHWAAKLDELGEAIPERGRLTLRSRALTWLAKQSSLDTVLPYIERAEHAGAGLYSGHPHATREMAADERAHARVITRMRSDHQFRIDQEAVHDHQFRNHPSFNNLSPVNNPQARNNPQTLNGFQAPNSHPNRNGQQALNGQPNPNGPQTRTGLQGLQSLNGDPRYRGNRPVQYTGDQTTQLPVLPRLPGMPPRPRYPMQGRHRPQPPVTDRFRAITLNEANEPEEVNITDNEKWHRSDRSGTLRAAVFGVNDGLVSNSSLVMGFAGSGATSMTILFAGLAGLLAGAFSMAAGEYISMRSQRDAFEREIELEAAELDHDPEAEAEELALIYRAKGLGAAEASKVASTIMADREVALETMTREELGLDPDELGSPWSAAGSSLIAFAAGAAVVVLPFLFGSGTAALIVAITLAALALFSVGAVLGTLNGRAAIRSGARQLGAGGAAGIIVFVVGHLIGSAVT